MTRGGLSYDIHALEGGTALKLGGFVVPAPYSAIAHSDGDVVLHALAEAILSALGLEDLGSYFPDTEEQTAGMDSRLILNFALEELQKHKATIANVVVHIMLEEPKLKEYKALIKKSLASLLHLAADRIAVHAGTAEGFGAVGEKKAVAALVLVTVSDSR